MVSIGLILLLNQSCQLQVMDNENFRCNMCPFGTQSFKAFRNHYVRTHQNDANFSVACCIGQCGYTTRKWATFRSHLSRKHSNTIAVENIVTVGEASENASSEEEVQHSQAIDKKYFNAMFCLSLQSEHNLSESGVDAVVSSTSTLLDIHIDALKCEFRKKLEERNIDPTIIDDIPVEHCLSDFDSASKRQTHIENNFPYVSPQGVILGKYYLTVNGILTEKHNIGYIIPFKDSLKRLLELPELWHHVQNPHFTDSSEFMFDICDGQYIRTHPLFSRNPRSLQIVLNTDDLEIVNPLGSHVKKHKISIFYYTLANIPPQYRSRLTAIQLLAVAKTKHVRVADGVHKLLSDFICTLNTLSGGGVKMHLYNAEYTVEGALVLVPADTLAAHWLGGFKEAVSFAVKNCRNCETSSETMAQKLVDSQCTERNHNTHVERCEQLAVLSKKAKIYWSKMWGINSNSCLMKVNGFPLSQGLVQDPMHILLEGVVRHELTHLLRTFIFRDHYFSLQWLNTALSGFSYSYLHSSTKPEPIEKNQIDGNGCMKQTSAATFTMIQVLPFVIGCQVPQNNKHWMNYLRLLQIVLLCTSCYCSSETPGLLRILISLYLQGFKRLYPDASFLPKMHYMLHFPNQMIRYGPIRHHWVFRYEGKHGFFKRKKYRNFRNLPYSMAKHHQLNMCYKQAGTSGERAVNFLYAGDIVGQGKTILLKEVFPALYNQMCELTSDEVGEVYIAQYACIHGLQYKEGCALVEKYDGFTPSFVVLKHIIVHSQDKFFVLESTNCIYSQHVASYILTLTGLYYILPFISLKFRWPLSVYSYEGETVVMNCHSHCCEIY